MNSEREVSKIRLLATRADYGQKHCSLLIANCSLKQLIAIVFFFIANFYLYSQNIQMSWQGGENALHYEIEIERETDDGFVRHLTETTAEKVLYITLPPGNYCYRIIPYDMLERPGDATEWIYFDVKEIKEEFPTENTEELKKEQEQPRERKPRNYFINIGAAYMPVIPVFSSNDLEAEYIGAALRMSVNFPLTANTYLGPEISGTWNDGIINAGLNIRFFRMIDNSNSGFVARFGAEYTIPYDDRMLESPLNLIGGFSFIWQVTSVFNIELGFDLVSVMSMPPDGFIRPFVGVGVRF